MKGYSLDFVKSHTREFFQLFNPVHTEDKFHQYDYNIFPTHVFRYHSAFQTRIKEQKQILIPHAIICYSLIINCSISNVIE